VAKAVRNKHDLNVTAMPAKYREMADFHEYYSGARRAPVLTIFIGGNHEASNHLFELYYGGWVAPNIYYMGAANVMKIGNLRISAMSGIWKGYDYRKNHYERLPYNDETMRSIFHVRELDVRKLLAVRSQVDVGLSHDWPNKIEWDGNYNWLFSKKQFFRADAENGRLGNNAAREVLDRLRPRHWFSAHLHVRYTAKVEHEKQKEAQLARETNKKELSAWNTFHETARVEEAAETQTFLQEQQLSREARANGNLPVHHGPVYEETFKKVTVSDDLSRKVEEPKVHTLDPESSRDTLDIPQYDGACASRPLKRPREPDSPPVTHALALQSSESVQTKADTSAMPVSLDGTSILEAPVTPAAEAPNPAAALRNPDELSIILSDDEDEEPVAKPSPPPRASSPFPNLKAVRQSYDVDNVQQEPSENGDDGGNAEDGPMTDAGQNGMSESHGVQDGTADKMDVDRSIPDDIRAELAGLSKTFAEPEKVEVSAALPFPEDITNKTTDFLALDKCLPGRHYLQLMEIESITAPDQAIDRPVKLKYDPEWLAILRAFAPELQLGGGKGDRAPQHRGDTYYQERVLEERKWVYEHIVSEDRLQVPDNFEITAPVYDASLEVAETDMPREVTNPQTTQFCQLIGIENQFDMSEEDRDVRIAAGPGEVEDRGWSHRGRGSRGRGRGGRGGRGARGGFRGGFRGGRGGRRGF
jgi:lariat debranching enzyme